MNSEPKFKDEIDSLRNKILCEKRMIELTNKNNELIKKKHEWEEKLLVVLEDAEINLSINPRTASREEASKVFNNMTDILECRVKANSYIKKLNNLGRMMSSLVSEHGFDFKVPHVMNANRE